MDITELQIFFHEQVEKITKCKVTETHQITDWFHNVPTKVMECTSANQKELS